jgi:hypothetical protein
MLLAARDRAQVSSERMRSGEADHGGETARRQRHFRPARAGWRELRTQAWVSRCEDAEEAKGSHVTPLTIGR